MGIITPFLWFDDQAEQAAAFYLTVFPRSRILDVSRYSDGGPGAPGSVMTVSFELDSNRFIALNGGPEHAGFDEAVSFVVHCADQHEVDAYWSALTDGGEEIACGWLKDRYGLRWQIVPDALPEILGDPDPKRAARAMRAMLSMKKLDIDAMRAAADGPEVDA